MTSQAYNNDILLFPLEVWKQPHRIKCSDQFRVKKQDTDCLEHLHKKNAKPSVNVSVSHMPEFSYRHQDFYWFYRGEVKSDKTLIEWERNDDVLVAIPSPLILVEKSNVKLQKQQSRGDLKNNIQRNETKSISVRVMQFLVNSLFYTWTLIKSEFLRI